MGRRTSFENAVILVMYHTHTKCTVRKKEIHSGSYSISQRSTKQVTEYMRILIFDLHLEEEKNEELKFFQNLPVENEKFAFNSLIAFKKLFL
jgi:hypothetical protein